MLTPEVTGAFFAASVLLGLAPGPDNLFVLSQSALHGRCAGLSVIFQTSALAFSLLKYAGAAYLAWLAWGALRAPASTLPPGSTPAVSRWKLYRRGILMNVTNPKVSVFFLAFLPQFADPARGSVTVQMLLLGGLFIAATVLVFGGIALLAGTLGQWLARSARAQVILNRLAGLVFLGLALKLATAER
jgi:threonine/homoserine/homoserine lactone efflux protein